VNAELWDSIDDKSAFVNMLLAKERHGRKVGHESIGRLQDEITNRVISTPVETPLVEVPDKKLAEVIKTVAKNTGVITCEHGAAKGFCRFSKCKFS
jgi:hypothetical protein